MRRDSRHRGHRPGKQLRGWVWLNQDQPSTSCGMEDSCTWIMLGKQRRHCDQHTCHTILHSLSNWIQRKRQKRTPIRISIHSFRGRRQRSSSYTILDILSSGRYCISACDREFSFCKGRSLGLFRAALYGSQWPTPYSFRCESAA